MYICIYIHSINNNNIIISKLFIGLYDSMLMSYFQIFDILSLFYVELNLVLHQALALLLLMIIINAIIPIITIIIITSPSSPSPSSVVVVDVIFVIVFVVISFYFLLSTKHTQCLSLGCKRFENYLLI